jgi:hypothetical protein
LLRPRRTRPTAQQQPQGPAVWFSKANSLKMPCHKGFKRIEHGDACQSPISVRLNIVNVTFQ